MAVLLHKVYGDLDIDEHLGDPEEEQYVPGPNRPRPSGDNTPGAGIPLGHQQFYQVPFVVSRIRRLLGRGLGEPTGEPDESCF